LALLPASEPLAWDELMHSPRYQRALEILPRRCRTEAGPAPA
jgi:hypothetical protein